MYPLKDKCMILTGASRGIGLALAPMLAQRGTHLVLNARDSDPLEDAATMCRRRAPGAIITSLAGDAADPSIAARLVEAALGVGSFHGFIHAAAIFDPGPFLWELEPHRFQAIFAANVFATYQLARCVVPVLRSRGEGLIVVFGSGAAVKVQPGIAAYSAAKAAEEALARHLASEAPGITTFVFRPGIVETRMQVEAREARGGASEQIHSVFRPWKAKGMLLTPDASAARLIEILEDNPRRFHGTIEQSMETRSVGGTPEATAK